MFPQENEYKSLLPKNAHSSPNFDKAACTIFPEDEDDYQLISPLILILTPLKQESTR